MIERKKRLRFIQLTLLIVGILIIYFVYYGNKSSDEAKLVSQSMKKNIEEDKTENTDVFFNIEYTGLDMNGNRYLLKSKEAYLDELKPEIIYMTDVNATFYFKDDTVLYVSSDKGVYNNKTLDMNFEQNVKANYLKSQLFAEKADYSNSKSYLSIYKNVKINDERGNLSADKLLFDITKKKLDITSFNDGNIDANVNLK
tara:strand:+ start:615 stop:1211 length:597 start_codon:yes stop_codon:yes gene_type:complete